MRSRAMRRPGCSPARRLPGRAAQTNPAGGASARRRSAISAMHPAIYTTIRVLVASVIAERNELATVASQTSAALARIATCGVLNFAWTRASAPRQVALLGERERQARSREESAVERAEHDHDRAERDHLLADRSPQHDCRIRKRRRARCQCRNGSDADDLDTRVQDQHDQQRHRHRERHVAPRIARLAGSDERCLEADEREDAEQHRVAEIAGRRQRRRVRPARRE